MSGPWGNFGRKPIPPEKPEPKSDVDAEIAKVVSIKEWEARARERGESLADLVGDAPWDLPAA